MSYRKNKAYGLSAKRRKIVCDMLRQGFTLKESAWECGVHHRTLEDWRRNNASFDREVYLAIMEWRKQKVAQYHKRDSKNEDRLATKFVQRRLNEMEDGPTPDGGVDEFFGSVDNTTEVNVNAVSYTHLTLPTNREV